MASVSAGHSLATAPLPAAPRTGPPKRLPLHVVSIVPHIVNQFLLVLCLLSIFLLVIILLPVLPFLCEHQPHVCRPAATHSKRDYEPKRTLPAGGRCLLPPPPPRLSFFLALPFGRCVRPNPLWLSLWGLLGGWPLAIASTNNPITSFIPVVVGVLTAKDEHLWTTCNPADYVVHRHAYFRPCYVYSFQNFPLRIRNGVCHRCLQMADHS